MFLLNNIKVHQDVQRTIGDVQYPAGWFSHDAEARAKVGMIEVPDIPRPDDNLFTSVENPDGSWTATPRTPEDLAARALVDASAYQEQRAAAYPPATDYLDGIVKGDAAQVQAYVDACLAVKAKYPKP